VIGFLRGTNSSIPGILYGCLCKFILHPLHLNSVLQIGHLLSLLMQEKQPKNDPQYGQLKNEYPLGSKQIKHLKQVARSSKMCFFRQSLISMISLLIFDTACLTSLIMFWFKVTSVFAAVDAFMFSLSCWSNILLQSISKNK